MKTYKFSAKIEPAFGGGAYVFFPFDMQEAFGTKAKVPIKATIGGVDYRGSLTPYGQPQHMLHVSKAIRQETGKDIGDTIEVELWKDEEVRTLEVPGYFQALLTEHGLQAFFDSLSYTHRKEYVRWVTGAKTEATNAKRLARAIEMLKHRIKTLG